MTAYIINKPWLDLDRRLELHRPCWTKRPLTSPEWNKLSGIRTAFKSQHAHSCYIGFGNAMIKLFSRVEVPVCSLCVLGRTASLVARRSWKNNTPRFLLRSVYRRAQGAVFNSRFWPERRSDRRRWTRAMEIHAQMIWCVLQMVLGMAVHAAATHMAAFRTLNGIFEHM